MKKLALALVCLVSVAFFASCTPEGDPTIRVLNEEGYIQNGDVVNLGEVVKFGFVMSSAIETSSPLTKLIVKIDDNDPDTIALNSTTYTYEGSLEYGYAKDTIVGTSTISAIVYDALGRFALASISISLNQAEEPLTAGDFDWYRLGNEQSGLAEFGLYWHQNAKSPFAQIKPLDGVVLYKFDSNVWDQVATPTQKAAVFADGATTAAMYNNVDVNANGMYDDVIGTRMADGTLHLLHVTSCVIGAQQTAGRPIHIYGQHK